MNYFFLILFFFSNTLFANFAFVDSAKLVEKSLAYLDLMKQLDDLQEQHKKEFSAVESELQERYKKLIEGRDQISAQEFEFKTKEYQQDAEDFRVRILKLRETYDNLKAAGLKKIHATAERLSQDLMVQKKYSAMLEKSAIYVNASLIDVTHHLLEALNKELPKIDLEVKG